MSLFEQFALGGLCLGRAAREALRPAAWGAWLPLLAVRLAVVVALAWAAHPALSWAMAPLARLVARGDVLRFPQWLAQLAPLAARADLFAWALVGMPCAGAATRGFAAVFGRPVPPVRDAAREAVTLVLAGLPFALVAIAAQAGLDALAGVRLSGLTRPLLPVLAAGVVLAARATTGYVVAEVALDGASALEALAAIPRAWRPGFLPALLVLGLAALAEAPFGWLEPLAAAGRLHALPEAAIPVALAHAVVGTFVSMVTTGALALAWLAVIDNPENRP